MSLESDVKESKPAVAPVDVDECAVCHEPLLDNDDERTLVKLRCRHEFHLDCIGSCYNKKNRMECPTCRQIEKGDWLFAQPEEPSIEDSLPTTTIDSSVLEQLAGQADTESPTIEWPENVIEVMNNHIFNIFHNQPPPVYAPAPVYAPPPVHAPAPVYEPDQIAVDGHTSWDTMHQRHREEHIALIAECERRLHEAMYHYHVCFEGDGESSDGEDEESSSGDEVAEGVAPGDAAEGTEE